jgi:hypothetical protein
VEHAACQLVAVAQIFLAVVGPFLWPTFTLKQIEYTVCIMENSAKIHSQKPNLLHLLEDKRPLVNSFLIGVQIHGEIHADTWQILYLFQCCLNA